MDLLSYDFRVDKIAVQKKKKKKCTDRNQALKSVRLKHNILHFKWKLHVMFFFTRLPIPSTAFLRRPGYEQSTQVQVTCGQPPLSSGKCCHMVGVPYPFTVTWQKSKWQLFKSFYKLYLTGFQPFTDNDVVSTENAAPIKLPDAWDEINGHKG